MKWQNHNTNLFFFFGKGILSLLKRRSGALKIFVNDLF